MSNQAWNRVSIGTAPQEWRRAFHLGWLHAQTGAPFCVEYDLSMTRPQQIGYEQGRLLMFAACSVQLPIPAWSGFTSGASRVEELWDTTWLALGEFVPRNFVPAPDLELAH